MDIEKRIFELLYFKDCVIIPDLGGFVSQYVPARIREETQTFIPPSKELGFKGDLLHDDGLLSGYIATCDKISHSASRILIDGFVDRLKEMMSDGKTVHLRSLGSFSYSRTGELVFSASRDTNFLADSFGLSSFHYTRPETKHEHPLLRSALFKPREKGRVIALPETKNKADQDRNFRRLAMAIPLLVVISFLPLNSRKSVRNGQHPAGLFPIPELSIAESDQNNLSSNPSEIKFDSAAESLFLTETKETQPNTTDPSLFNPDHLAVVAGSFSSEKNALILKQDLLDKGYFPEIWKAANGFYRVIIQAHENMAKAESALAKLREELTEIDFWILQ